MSDQKGQHNQREPVCSKIRSLLVSLTKEPLSKYGQIAPKIEYWIEYVLREDFITVDDLVEGVSWVAWDDGGSFANVGRFLREFRDAPHRSEQARSFISQLCPYVLRWFAIASVEDLWTSTSSLVSRGGAPGFIRAASFVGHTTKCGLLTPELFRRYLIKPLINHHNIYENHHCPEAVRANALYQLFSTAGSALLQGLLDLEDVETCFGIFGTRSGWIEGFDSAKVKVRLCLLRRHPSLEPDPRAGISRDPRCLGPAETERGRTNEGDRRIHAAWRGRECGDRRGFHRGEDPRCSHPRCDRYRNPFPHLTTRCRAPLRLQGCKLFTQSLSCHLDGVHLPYVKHLHCVRFHLNGARREDRTQWEARGHSTRYVLFRGWGRGNIVRRCCIQNPLLRRLVFLPKASRRSFTTDAS